MLEQWGISLMSSWISYNVGKKNNIPARKRVGPKRVIHTITEDWNRSRCRRV